MGLGAGVLAAAVLAVGSPPGQGANITAYARDAYARPSARAAIGELRRSWGVFRDRRPELYGALMTLDGKTKSAAT